MTNRLYFGDCLDVMREDIRDESVDLIYLDPPFNSKRLYNAFLGGAQWVAFDDTWRWHEAIDDFHECASDVALAPTMEGLRSILGDGPNLAYLSYMANRLRDCRRVLKPTGSIYLHCDPTMSHYLKVVMDGIFGAPSFRNEIVWRRYGSHNDTKRFGRVYDVILYYSTGGTWNGVTLDLDPEYVRKTYRLNDGDGRGPYRTAPLHTGGLSGGGYDYEFRGHARTWRYPADRMAELGARNLIRQGRGGEGVPERKVYLADNRGRPASNMWDDIQPLTGNHAERLGYPTQKPIALVERIISASSNPGDVVLDPFCGCGTALHAAQNLGREWIGVDICVNACKVIEGRLRQHFDTLWSDIEFIGMPKTRDDARELAHLDAFRFERWAASLVDGVEANTRQRGDGGIDGRGRIPIRKGQFIDLVSQVKGGSTGPGDVQAFNGARQQAGADLGIFTCFEDRVTPRMRDAAASAGRFMSVPAVQIYTVEDFFNARRPRIPAVA